MSKLSPHGPTIRNMRHADFGDTNAPIQSGADDGMIGSTDGVINVDTTMVVGAPVSPDVTQPASVSQGTTSVGTSQVTGSAVQMLSPTVTSVSANTTGLASDVGAS